MARRIAWYGRWRLRTSRIGAIIDQFRDLARIAGFPAACGALGHRAMASLKHRLVRPRHKAHAGLVGHGRGAGQPAEAAPQREGVRFIGYVEANLGLGESLRGLVNSAASAKLPFAIWPFNVNVESRFVGPFRPESYDTDGAYPINVIETATDQLPLVRATVGESLLSGSYNVLRTYWELPSAPANWQPLLDWIDEIWAPNDFVADAFRPIFPGPIVVLPPCVEPEPPQNLPRSHFGLKDGVFYFLFSFDYFSYPARKNPIGVLQAFQAAFDRDDARVGLVIKSTGSRTHFPEIRAIINRAAKSDPRIVVIDRTLTRGEIVSLIADCDCYLSLHRSEGFGLGMVEAMVHAKPVIGTDFSGSQDFLSAETGFPVPCQLRPVRPGEYVDSDGQIWAEPDIEAASQAMRDVVADPEATARRAHAGQAFVRQRYSRSNVGAEVAARVAMIGQLRRHGDGPEQPTERTAQGG